MTKNIKNKQWEFNDARFEYQPMLDDFSEPWVGLRRFGYDLMTYVQPKVVCELGVYRGTSFFSFLQAAKDKKLKTSFIGVDTWEGDQHTGFYDTDIYDTLGKIIKKYYKKIDLRLMQMTFDKAVKKVLDGSIDILHIDGLHTFGAVKHDFQTWESKVGKKGIIMFHDIHYFKRNFGVYKLWDQLKNEFHTLELKHSNGLGILFKDKAMFDQLKDLEKFWQIYYPVKADQDRLEYKLSKNAHIEDIDRLKKALTEAEHNIVHLTKDKKELKKQLKIIKQAKFYKTWQAYCNVRDVVLKRKR